MTDERDTEDVAERTRAAFERAVPLVPGDTMLHPPASDSALDAAEAHLGQRLPADVRAVYRLADGQVQYRHDDPRWAAGLLGGEPLLPLADVLLQWDQWAGFDGETGLDEHASSTPQGFVREKYSVRDWIPLTHDGGGNHLGVDLDPDVDGTVGQVITFGRDDEEPWSLRVPAGTSPHSLFRAQG